MLPDFHFERMVEVEQSQMLQQSLIFLVRDYLEVKVVFADFAPRDDFHLIPGEKHLVEQYANIIGFIPLHTRAAFIGREGEFILGRSLNDETIHAEGRGFVTTQGDKDVVRVLEICEEDFVHVFYLSLATTLATRTPKT